MFWYFGDHKSNLQKCLLWSLLCCVTGIPVSFLLTLILPYQLFDSSHRTSKQGIFCYCHCNHHIPYVKYIYIRLHSKSCFLAENICFSYTYLDVNIEYIYIEIIMRRVYEWMSMNKSLSNRVYVTQKHGTPSAQLSTHIPHLWSISKAMASQIVVKWMDGHVNGHIINVIIGIQNKIWNQHKTTIQWWRTKFQILSRIKPFTLK